MGISKSMGLAQISFAEAYKELEPDMIVLLGDRYETFAAAAAAQVSRIPIAHIHGGESTEGAIDEAFRHSITKMSHLHFTAAEIYRKRVIQLGEAPNRVFNVGALGVENIVKQKLLTRSEVENLLNFQLGERNLIITFHPVTLENQTAENQFNEILKSISKLDDFKFIFTKSNSDTDGRVINCMIDDYVKNNKSRSMASFELGQALYFSLIKLCTVIGNSSSGLLEVPSFKIPTINVGDRQKGRLKASV